MNDDPMRLSTAEREQASARLADHFAEGRLDHDEYAERLDRIWAARTRGELRPVFRDLPGPRPSTAAPGRPAAWAPRAPYVGFRRGPRFPFPFALVAALLVALVVVTHLPVFLLALGVWFFVFRGRCRPVRVHHRRW